MHRDKPHLGRDISGLDSDGDFAGGAGVKVKPQPFRIVIPVRIGNLRGAGDLVALGAEPVKHVIQRIRPGWNCGGCDKRRERLNRAVSFGGASGA